MLRPREDLEDVALLDDASAFDHGDIVGDRADHRHFVRDEQDRQAKLRVDAGEKVEDRARRFRIERRSRLVGEQHLRVRGERAGDADALLLAAGEFGRVAIALVGKSDEKEELVDPRPDRGAVVAGDLERQGDILGGSPRREQVEMLEDHADRTPRVAKRGLGQGGDFGAVDDNPAGARLFKPVDQADQGRLAGARTPDHAKHRALADGQIDGLERRHGRLAAAREDLGDARKAHHGRRGHEALGRNPGEAGERNSHAGTLLSCQHNVAWCSLCQSYRPQ